ncbi:interferon regulatory factor 1-like [Limulus polyphemus]|uniref:Interferon regulatory factor 1-like n=1 Tax=Limulus polyphemus TaxID=6850 RepID=A0ABM1S2J7_LIMPO|nr:interferon regulatory factor 1-like [Limulus polyphemus]
MFKIPWRHASSKAWDEEIDTKLYRLWVENTGKTVPPDLKCKKLKANFRCALRSRPDIEEVKGLRTKEYRVFRFTGKRKYNATNEKQVNEEETSLKVFSGKNNTTVRENSYHFPTFHQDNFFFNNSEIPSFMAVNSPTYAESFAKDMSSLLQTNESENGLSFAEDITYNDDYSSLSFMAYCEESFGDSNNGIPYSYFENKGELEPMIPLTRGQKSVDSRDVKSVFESDLDFLKHLEF